MRRAGLLTLFIAACSGGEILTTDDAAVEPDAGAPDVIPLHCGPTGGGPYWLEETETVTFTLGCISGHAFSGDAFELADPPAGMTYDAATRTVAWTPGLDQAAVWTVTVRSRPTGESGTVTIGVADRYDHADNVAIADPKKYAKEMGLPVFYIEAATIVPDVYNPGTLTHGGGVYAMEIKIRGRTTRDYPKNSYTLKFPGGQEFNEPDEGFVDKRRVCLTTTFDDTSHLRHRFSFHLWETLDPGHLFVQQYSAVVWVNGEYIGLYAVSDHIDKHMLGAFGLNEAGNLYESINHHANYKATRAGGSTPKDSLDEGYLKKEGLPIDDYSDVIALVTFVIDASNTDFTAGIGDRIDLRDFQDAFLLVTALAAYDNITKNTYTYRDPAGGKWRYIPWDFNATWGQNWQTFRQSANDNTEATTSNGLWNRFKAIAALNTPLQARYASALRNQWKKETLLATWDSWVARIRPSAKRDERKWLQQHREWDDWDERTDIQDFDGETAYVRKWISDRWDVLLARHP